MAVYDPPVYTSISPGSNWGEVTMAYPPPDIKELSDIRERLSAIEDRLAIIRPDVVLHEKYASLKEAYEHYKLIEKLVRDQNGL
jgi:hypothetical protein